MDIKTLGKNLRMFRIDKKLSQEDLATLAGVSRNYISMIERGSQGINISDQIIQKLAGGLNITIDQLLGKPNEGTGTLIPPELRKFALEEHLPYDIVDTLMQVPFRGKKPTTVEEWKNLYNAIKPYIFREK